MARFRSCCTLLDGTSKHGVESGITTMLLFIFFALRQFYTQQRERDSQTFEALLVVSSGELEINTIRIICGVCTRGVCFCSLPRGGGAHSFVACPSHLTIDHASLSRRSAVPPPNRDTSNSSALIAFFSVNYIETFSLSYPLPVSLFLWPPSIS